MLLPFNYRIILAPLSIAGTEQDSAVGTILELNLTVAVADVLECLVEKTPTVSNVNGIDYCPVGYIEFNFFLIQCLLHILHYRLFIFFHTRMAKESQTFS